MAMTQIIVFARGSGHQAVVDYPEFAGLHFSGDYLFIVQDDIPLGDLVEFNRLVDEAERTAKARGLGHVEGLGRGLPIETK